MSILDNEGHDPLGFGNITTNTAEIEIERLRAWLQKIATFSDGWAQIWAQRALAGEVRPGR